MGIYVRPARQLFTLTVGGPDLTSQFAISWEAFSVVVNNRTNQHVFLPDAKQWVPPGVFGAIIVMPGVTQAQAKFQAPPGVRDVPPTAGQVATLTYLQEELSPNPGVVGGLGASALTGPAAATVGKFGIAGIAGGAAQPLYQYPNQQLTLYNGWVFPVEAEAGTIFSFYLRNVDGSVGADFALFTHNTLQPQPFDFGGYTLPVGIGVGLKNYGVAVHNYDGVLKYVAA